MDTKITEPIPTYHYRAAMEGDMDFVDQRHCEFLRTLRSSP